MPRCGIFVLIKFHDPCCDREGFCGDDFRQKERKGTKVFFWMDFEAD